MRLHLVEVLLLLAFLSLLGRLFYWQVLAASRLAPLADIQYQSSQAIPAERGLILAQDGFPLVKNDVSFTLFAYKPDLDLEPEALAGRLAPHLNQPATDLAAKLATASANWIPLARNLNQTVKEKIAQANLAGLGFETGSVRLYPEASMAAQVIGFIGSDGNGKPKGYFGLEGYYNLELTGKPGFYSQEKDVHGRPIAFGRYTLVESRPGRTLKTHLHRGLQLLVEEGLKQGLQKYQATKGEVVVLDPQSGAVLALASLPAFDPAAYRLYPGYTYRSPVIADTYEPGSTFKTVVMAAALDTGVVNPEDICDLACAGPVTIGSYTIKTWNNEYHPGETMTEILERSDNVGMIYVTQKLGKDKLVDYLKNFGFAEATGIYLEVVSVAPLRRQWGDIDLATGSFGQGVAVTAIQMVTAVAALGNGGLLFEPQVVSAVIDQGETLDIKPKMVRRVISRESSALITQMLVKSALHGEAKWRLPKGYTIAGKTGTAQVPVAGHYDADKTIASFVGFAPADKPRFAMLVKLTNPQSSPWASETAAPLWFDLAGQLLLALDIPPQP